MARSEVDFFLSRAAYHKTQRTNSRRPRPLEGKVVMNAFFEDSTRTRTSFEIAAKLLGAELVNLTASGSSLSKGETLLDTVRNLESMGLSALVVRHSASGAPHLIARYLKCSVINAGDGTHEHPSQALLDVFTLLERFSSLEGKTVVMVGDILHSRVARSNMHCLKLMGAKVILCGPPTLIPVGVESPQCEITYNFAEALTRADAVMMLRIQLERQTESLFPSAREYARLYGLNSARAATLKSDAVILHPGPINRGVEIASEVADSRHSVILDQVANGVAVRMAILEACI